MRRIFIATVIALSLPVAWAQDPIRVTNRGIPGANSTEIRRDLDVALQQRIPAFVVIFAGTNDALNDAKFLTTAQTVENLGAMVRQVRAAGATPIVVTLHHVDSAQLMKRHRAEAYGDRGPRMRVDELNLALKQMAEKNNVSLADFGLRFEQAGDRERLLGPDGVHLTRAGYAVLAKTVRDRLPKEITPGQWIVCVGDSLTFGVGVRALKDDDENTQTYPAQLESLLVGSKTR